MLRCWNFFSHHFFLFICFLIKKMAHSSNENFPSSKKRRNPSLSLRSLMKINTIIIHIHFATHTQQWVKKRRIINYTNITKMCILSQWRRMWGIYFIFIYRSKSILYYERLYQFNSPKYDLYDDFSLLVIEATTMELRKILSSWSCFNLGERNNSLSKGNRKTFFGII